MSEATVTPEPLSEATALSLRVWACERAGVISESSASETRRQLYSRLADHDFEPSQSWLEAVGFAATDPAKLNSAAKVPIDFLQQEDDLLTDSTVESLKSVLHLTSDRQLQRLTEIEASLTPFQRARFAVVVDVLKSRPKRNVQVPSENAREFMGDMLELALTTPTERPTRRRSLAKQRRSWSYRRAAKRVHQDWPPFAKLDPAYLGLVSGIPHNVNVGWATAAQPTQSSSRWTSYWPIAVIVMAVLRMIVGSGSPQPPVVIPIESNPAFVQSRRENVARFAARGLENRTLDDLAESPPAPGWVTDAARHLSAEACRKLIKVYEGRIALVQEDPARLAQVAQFNLATRALRERLLALGMTSAASGDQSDAAASTDNPQVHVFSANIDVPPELSALTGSIDPSLQQLTADTKSRVLKLIEQARRNRYSGLPMDGLEQGVTEEELGKLTDKGSRMHVITTAEQLMKVTSSLPLSANKTMLSKLEAERTKFPARANALTPLIDALKDQIQKAEAAQPPSKPDMP